MAASRLPDPRRFSPVSSGVFFLSDTVVDNDRRNRLIEQTLEVWQSRTSGELTREDAREITENAAGFFKTLRRWAVAASSNSVGDSSATAEADQRSSGRGEGGPSQ